ncbi:MAG: hypothetical protein ABI743_14445, partial [bacterium]
MRTTTFLLLALCAALMLEGMNPVVADTASPVVQLVYMVPSDRTEQPVYREVTAAALRDVQHWIASKMEGRTFRIQEPMIVMHSTHDAEWFATNPTGGDPAWICWENAFAELTAVYPFDPTSIVYVVYVDADQPPGTFGGGGREGVCIVPADDLRGLSGEPIHGGG